MVALTMGIASAAAWQVAKLMGSKHPFLAPVSVILCMQPTLAKSLQYSYYRILGTVLGVGVTVLAARWLPHQAWTIGLVIVIAGLISLIFGRKEVLIRETALSVALVLDLQKKSGIYPFDRVRDTFIGVVVALIVQFIVHRAKGGEPSAPSSE